MTEQQKLVAFFRSAEGKGVAISCAEAIENLPDPDLTEAREMAKDAVDFYEREFYPLSNFSAFRVKVDGIWFDTSEQAYHYAKFPDSKGHRHAIMTAISAHEAFKYAEAHKADRRPDWDTVKVGIMGTILRAKVEQHEYVRRKLLETGDRKLIEQSWRDDFWGWGPNHDGQNMLGKLWMEIRSECRAAIDAARQGKEHG